MSDVELRSRAAAVGPECGRASALGAGTRRVRPGTVLALAFAAFLLVATVAPSLLQTAAPNAIAPRDAFSPPSLAHWFGTDESGRDVYSRVVQGTGASLAIGASATAIGLAIGLILGAVAALGGSVLDFVVGRVNEVLFAFPGILLALLVIVLWGPGPVTATIAVGLSTAPGYARIIRGELLSIRDSGFVEAARVLGHGPFRIFARHVLPNALVPVAALATLGIGQAVVWASSLSYLGLGAQPPAAEWGAMLAAGRTYITTAWWLTVFPGLMIVLTTLATTVLGRAITARDGRRR
ncbi:ABC transporter permease subunit [Agromyces sp. CFH 90414]|uniref:ABC transporter permease subunit n=1 Tax=Agromyces agglutinans TaxID=2662258 RepID=A0A6I2F7W7_9MICO|nr:ABC transporter permease [Agromyces agglutinans]MRG58486.1 ABC transporter permease subunit [Agromyces agglutinans]